MWDHQADVELLLKQLEEATQQLPRDASHATGMPFGANRFAMQSVNIMVIATGHMHFQAYKKYISVSTKRFSTANSNFSQLSAPHQSNPCAHKQLSSKRLPNCSSHTSIRQQPQHFHISKLCTPHPSDRCAQKQLSPKDATHGRPPALHLKSMLRAHIPTRGFPLWLLPFNIITGTTGALIDLPLRVSHFPKQRHSAKHRSSLLQLISTRPSHAT